MTQANNVLHTVSADLLQVSQYLTAFCTIYSRNDDPKELTASITPADLLATLEYLHEKERLEALKDSAAVEQRRTEQSDVPVQHEIQALEQSLPHDATAATATATTSTNKQQQWLVQLWERFVVWTTKALCQHVFLSHHHEITDKSQVACWSMLLNLPTASYSSANLPSAAYTGTIATASATTVETEPATSAPDTTTSQSTTASSPFGELWNACYNTHSTHVCGLTIPPCIDTWQEYARLAHMLAALTETQRAAAHLSPFTGCARIHKETTSSKWQWTTPDLAALWVRAQRNTQAARHLLHLFEIQQSDPDRAIDGSDTTAAATTTKLTAVFSGNHRLMYRRIVQESSLVDSVCEWAVSNQLLFTQHWIQAALKRPAWLVRRKRAAAAVGRRPKRRKQTNNTDQGGNGNVENKDTQLDLWSRTELSRACQKYLLRWLARRHGPALEILFFKDPVAVDRSVQEGVHVGMCCIRLKQANIMEYIQAKLATSDRTLLRIDRRINLGKYDDAPDTAAVAHEANSTCPFYTAMHELLVALRDSVANLKMDTTPFHAAINSFDKLYFGYLSVKKKNGIVAAARTLMDPTADITPKDLAGVLLGHPTPWVSPCAVCNESVVGVGGYKTCASCEIVIHNKCATGTNAMKTLRAQSFVKSCPPLREMYRIQLPDLPPPDYRDERSSELEWTMKVIEVNRKLGIDAELERYGLVFRHTETCEASLDFLLNENSLVSYLHADESYPHASKEVGLVVISVEKNCCSMVAGVLPGDVIVAVQLLEFMAGAGDDENSKFVKSKDYTLAKVAIGERMPLFGFQATKMRLVVQRPHKNIALEGAEFLGRVTGMNLNAALKYSLDANDTIGFCAQCRTKDEAKKTAEGEKARTHREAKFCRAVIRRLGMEAYGIPFFDEPAKFPVVTVSLRRLDRMMDRIMLHSSNVAEIVSSDTHLSSDAAFFVSGSRVDWAPGSLVTKPVELLCRGICQMIQCHAKLPQRPKTTLASHTEDQRLFISHFLRIFCSWCLAPGLENFSAVGPAPQAANARDASVDLCCESCLVRSIPESSSVLICDLCVAAEASISKDPKLGPVLASYEMCAALVGTTVLVLPDDNLTLSVKETLGRAGVRLEDHGRPVELLVVSYLPSSVERKDKTEDPALDGTYHLLPVAGSHQLQYLLGRSKVRQSSTPASDDTLERWKADGLLDLEGVVILSFSDLRSKLLRTTQIHDAITAEVARRVHCSSSFHGDPNCSPPDERGVDGNSRSDKCSSSNCCLESSQLARFERPKGEQSSGDIASEGAALIDGFVISCCPLFYKILKSSGVEAVESVDSVVDVENRFSSTKGARISNTDSLSIRQSDWSSSDDGKHNASSDASLDPSPIGPPETGLSVRQSLTAESSNLHPSQNNRNTSFLTTEDVIELVADLTKFASEVAGRSETDPLRIVRDSQPAPLSRPPSQQGFHATQTNTTQGYLPGRLDPFRDTSSVAYTHQTTSRALSNIRVYQMQDLPALRALSTKVFGAREIEEHDLYRSSLPGIILTMAETAVLLSAICRGYPMLGVRLLCPRYDVKTIFQQVPVLYSKNLLQVCKLSDSLWTYIARLDYQRQLREPLEGVIRFRDLFHNEYSVDYQMPTGIFPVDRFIEECFRKEHQLANVTSRNGFQGPGVGLAAIDLTRDVRSAPQVGNFGDARPNGHAFGSFEFDSCQSGHNDDHAERIRGGGGEGIRTPSPSSPLTSPGPDEICLAHIPSVKWNNLYVYTFCATTLEGMPHGEARVIGKVKCPSATPRNEVIVRMIYLSNIGLCAEPEEALYDPQDLYVVSPGSDDASLVADWEKRHTPQIEASPMEDEAPASESEPRSSAHGDTSETAKMLEVTPTMPENSLSCIRRLCTEQRGTTTRLGILPDGRQIYWFQCDPKALYAEYEITSDTMAVQNLSRLCNHHRQVRYRLDLGSRILSNRPSHPVLREAQPDAHCCVWGCSTQVSKYVRECLAFESSTELDDHLNACHMLPVVAKASQQATIRCQNVGFTRISEGEAIQRLCYDLTAAACARDPSLLFLCAKLEASQEKTASGKEFSQSPVDYQLCFKKLFALAATESQSDDVNEFIAIYSRIAQIFHVQGDGCFRLSDEEFAKASAANLQLPQGKGQHSTHATAFANHNHDPDCIVCALGSERILLENIDSEEDPNIVYRGIGCAMVSKVCFGKEIKTFPDKGSISRTKCMLLHLADTIPSALHHSEFSRSKKPGACAFLGQPLWDVFHIWRSFVIESRSLLSLAQALIVLIAGIDSDKLPVWWRSEGSGWGKPQVLLTSPSKSSLTLAMRVLDLAVTEFGAATCVESPVSVLVADAPAAAPATNKTSVTIDGLNSPSMSHLPFDLAKLSFDQRATQTLAQAQDLGMDRWDGEYGIYCSRCQDGGDLLCCELCFHVDHATCFYPPLDPTAEFYVCESCMTDVHAMQQNQQRDQV